VFKKESVVYRQEDGIASLTLNRPEAHNAINLEVLHRLATLLDNAKAKERP